MSTSVRTPSRKQKFSIGQRVTFVNGELNGRSGIVRSVTSSKRAGLMQLSITGRMVGFTENDVRVGG